MAHDDFSSAPIDEIIDGTAAGASTETVSRVVSGSEMLSMHQNSAGNATFVITKAGGGNASTVQLEVAIASDDPLWVPQGNASKAAGNATKEGTFAISAGVLYRYRLSIVGNSSQTMFRVQLTG